MADNKTISILEGNTFAVSDLGGDIDASPTETKGLFAFDTRYLSRWLLTLDGKTPNVLSTDDLAYFSAQFFLVPGTGTVYVDADLSIIRTREVGDGFHETLRILNHKTEPVDVDVRIAAAADFADLFEVKDALAKKGERYTRVERDRLVFGYRRDTFVRETWISSSAPETMLTEDGLHFPVHIDPHGEWTTDIDVLIFLNADASASAASAPCSKPRRGSSARGMRRSGSISAAWWTSPRCASSRGSPLAGRCPRRVCPGSWPSSAATAS